MRLSYAECLLLLPLIHGSASSTVQDNTSEGIALRPHEFYCAKAPSDQGLDKPPSLTVQLHKGPNDQAAWFMNVVVPILFEGRGEWAPLRAILIPQFEASCAQALNEIAFDWSTAACAQDIMHQVEDSVRNLCIDGASVYHQRSDPASSVAPIAHGGQAAEAKSMQSTRSLLSSLPEISSSTAHTLSSLKSKIAASDKAVAESGTPSLSAWTVLRSEIEALASLVVSTKSSNDIEEDWVSVGRSSTQRCEAMRRFSKLFTGQAAPALNALHSALLVEEDNEVDTDKRAAGVRATLGGLGAHDPSRSHVGSSSTYRQALTLLESSDFAGYNASKSWAALSRYALANLEHTIGAGRWDERAFPAAAARAARVRETVVQQGGNLVDGFVSVRQDEEADMRATSLLLQTMHLSVPLALQSAFKDSGNYSTTLSSGSSRSISNERPATNACAASRKRTSPASSALSSSSSLVHVITVASEGPGHPKLAALEASAAAAGPCVVLHVLRAGSDARGGDYVKESAAADGTGKDEAWGEIRWSNDWKPRRLLAFLRDKRRSSMISKHDLVVFVDGYDVLLSPHIADLKDRMLTAHLHKPVTFVVEHDCWPDAALCKWLTTSPYLNAGVFAGEKQHVLGMLEDMVHRLGEFAFCGDDQRAYQRYALERPDMIGLDIHSAVFQCMHGRNWHIKVEPPSHESTEATSSDQQGEEETIVWNTPLLYEVSGHTSPPPLSGHSPGDDSTKIARRPAVLHFNSYDGKKMMARYVQTALREVES